MRLVITTRAASIAAQTTRRKRALLDRPRARVRARRTALVIRPRPREEASRSSSSSADFADGGRSSRSFASHLRSTLSMPGGTRARSLDGGTGSLSRCAIRDLARVSPDERRPPRNHVIPGDAERVEVAPHIEVVPPEDLFRRDIVRRPAEEALSRPFRAARPLEETQVR
jgi:hypothetical protein